MDSNRILNQSHDAQTEIEHLTANLCEAGMEIFDLRAELVAALELSERWRTLAEYRLAQAERREGAAERRHASASDLVEIPEDWHHRAGVGRRWKDEPERRKASSERWRLFHRERRGVVTAEPEPPDSGHASRMAVAVVIGSILALAGLAVVLALWPSTGLAIASGLGVGVGVAAVMGGLGWVMAAAGMRHGHRLYLRELAKVAAVAR